MFGSRDGRLPQSTKGLENQIGKAAASVDRLATVVQRSRTLSDFQVAAANGEFSKWSINLQSGKKDRVAEKVAAKLAEAFIAASHQQVGPAASGGLTQAFNKLLTATGSVALQAAGTIESYASILSPVEQSALPGKLAGAFLQGVSEELGKKAVNGVSRLFNLLTSAHRGGSEPILLPQPVTVRVLPPPPVTVTVLPPPPVTVMVSVRRGGELPTSFVWFNRTWGRTIASRSSMSSVRSTAERSKTSSIRDSRSSTDATRPYAR